MNHNMHGHMPTEGNHLPNKGSQLSLAHSATLHCLLGCGIGEVIGVIIGTAAGLSNLTTLVLAVVLGFVFGFLLGMRPLLRAGFEFNRALHQVFIAESLSIFVMELTEVLVQVYTPGVMDAGLNSGIFWLGMGCALVAGYAAAFPVNYILVGKGIRHIH
jgi:hypothetical protein